jgi:hypothetical protein
MWEKFKNMFDIKIIALIGLNIDRTAETAKNTSREYLVSKN